MLINTSRNPFTTIISILSSIGAINWGLIGLFDFNLVSFLFGVNTNITKLIYVLVGLSGIYMICVISRILQGPSAKVID